MEREDIRLEQFRRLRKEIRGSEDYLIVGIDVGKDKHNAYLGTPRGKTLYRRLIFENSREGFEKLMFQVQAIRVQQSLNQVVFGMEPTANYHKPLGEFLINQEHQVVLVSPEAVKQNRKLLDGRWDKHDGKDCANVADLIAQGKCLYYEYPLPALHDLRNLLSLKRKLKKLEQGLRLRIRNHLVAQYFPEMDQYCNWGEQEGLALVRWCLDPAVMARLSEAEEKIEQVCLRFKEYPCLLSIPGFGPSLSAMVLGAIGNPWRFQNGAQVIKMVGLDLSASQSGKSQGPPSISKKGKAEIRYALYQAALVASSRDKHFVAYFTDQLRGREKEKGIKTKRRVKLAAKMLMIAWTLMKKQELFDPRYLSPQAEPINARKTMKTENRGIPEVQRGSDRGL